MTDYGYGALLKTSLECFKIQSRQSGRTQSMRARMKDGDILITTTLKEAQRLRDLAQEMGLDITVRIASSSSASIPVEMLRGRTGRLFIDHHWFKSFWEIRIKEAENELAWLAKRSQPLPKPLVDYQYNPSVRGGF